MARHVEPYILANLRATYAVPVLSRAVNMPHWFGSRLNILKEPRGTERGVLLVMFSEMLPLLCATMDMPRLLRDYTLVIEPSYPGLCDEDLLRFTQFEHEIFVCAKWPDDFRFCEQLPNIVPIDIGPCDWADPRLPEPYLGSSKQFDIVMNANWAGLKRHHALFRMLKRARRRYRVALIGGPLLGRTRHDLEALASYYGVLDQLTIFEHIPYLEVMKVTCQSRVAVLLSLKEGGNRGVSESMFCDVPVIMPANHVGGTVRNVVAETGLVVPERDLETAIERLLSASIHPREWALAHITCFESSRKLNAVLREHALQHNQPWTADIAPRASSPESRYVVASDAERLERCNDALGHYLL